MNKQKVVIEGPENKKSYSEINIRTLPARERVKRSFKKVALFWIIALGTAFIPVLHFILVPTFLILGIVLFFLSFKVKEIMVSSSGQCPACNEEFELEESNIKWPISQICSKCRINLELIIDK